MDFFEYSKSIVEEYLGTVAYVDDIIFVKDKNKVVPKTIEGVDIREKADQKTNLTEEKSEEKKKETVKIPINIDPTLLTNSFAEKGIHCSLLELSEDLSNKDSIKKTIKKSDVIILDWTMYLDNGEIAKELIRDILQHDFSNHTAPLRLIGIYTDSPLYKKIIEEHIIPILNELKITESKQDSELSIQFGFTKIVVIPKPKLGITKEGKYSCFDLPNLIINELSLLTNGIMPLYALQCITTIRKNTHRLLSIYNKDLDPGYLSHKILLPNTEDSKDHIYEIIGSEIKSIIRSNEIIDEKSLISDYLDYEYDDYSYDFDLFEKERFSEEFKQSLPKKLDKELLKTFTDVGLEKSFIKKTTDPLDKLHFEKTCHKNATKFFTMDNLLAGEIDKKFSILTTLKNAYPPNAKYLQQGTIVMETIKNQSNYWLCIQPKCDSVRIEKTRNFMFIKLTESDSYLDIIVPEGKKFKVDYHIYNTTLKKFKSNNGKIEAIVDDSGIYFDIFNGGQKLYWVCELKNDFAQLISNHFSAQISRVGLDHYEWLRRS